MNAQVKKLVLSSTILAAAMILVIFQIPLLGMGLDISFVALIIGRRYIGYWYTFIILLIYPWVSIYFMGPIGVIFLILQALGIVTLDFFINGNEFKIWGIILVIILGTIWSVLINLFIVSPMYWFLAGYHDGNFFGNYQNISDNEFWRYQLSWFVTGLIFNPIKLSLAYSLSYLIWKPLNKSVDQEKIK